MVDGRGATAFCFAWPLTIRRAIAIVRAAAEAMAAVSDEDEQSCDALRPILCDS